MKKTKQQGTASQRIDALIKTQKRNFDNSLKKLSKTAKKIIKSK